MNFKSLQATSPHRGTPRSHPPTKSIRVSHNPGELRFEAQVKGHLSVADYEKRDGTLIFTHTYVPSDLMGRGIAEKLVRAGLRHARDKKLRIVPNCPYVALFVERHPEFKAMLE